VYLKDLIDYSLFSKVRRIMPRTLLSEEMWRKIHPLDFFRNWTSEQKFDFMVGKK